MLKASLKVEPLTCPSCIKKIESTLNKVDGVETVKVLFNSSKVKIDFDDTKVDVSKLEKTIENLGYPVLSSQVKE